MRIKNNNKNIKAIKVKKISGKCFYKKIKGLKIRDGKGGEGKFKHKSR